MSAAFFIILKPEIKDFDAFVNGKVLSKYSDQLEILSKRHSIPFFYDFCGRKWHNPSEGLKMINLFLEFFENEKNSNDEVFSSVKEKEDLIEDLKEWKAVLEKAEECSVKWKAEVDY